MLPQVKDIYTPLVRRSLRKKLKNGRSSRKKLKNGKVFEEEAKEREGLRGRSCLLESDPPHTTVALESIKR